MRQNAICDSDATAKAAKREGDAGASAEAGRRINENSRHSGPDDAEGGRDIRYFISRVSLSLSVCVRFRRSNIFPFLSHRRRETGNADGGTVEINAATKNGYSLSDLGTCKISEKATC